MKKSNQIEYIVKGFDNKVRIEIIFLLNKKPELSVGEISSLLKINYRSASQHLLKMMATGIVMKRNSGSEVRHRLTEKGEKIADFLKNI